MGRLLAEGSCQHPQAEGGAVSAFTLDPSGLTLTTFGDRIFQRLLERHPDWTVEELAELDWPADVYLYIFQASRLMNEGRAPRFEADDNELRDRIRFPQSG